MEMTGLPSGTVYPAMRRLERDELIRSQWEQQSIADAEQRPPRKYYKLTRAGKPTLEASRKRYPLLAKLIPRRRWSRYDALPASICTRSYLGLVRVRFVAGAGDAACGVVQGVAVGACGMCGRLRVGGQAVFRSWSARLGEFCLGAFQDAFCLRVQSDRVARLSPCQRRDRRRNVFCLIVGLGAIGFGVAMMLPGVSAILHGPPYRDTRNLKLLRDAHYSNDSVPTISAAQYQVWKRRRQELFDGFSFQTRYCAAEIVGIESAE